MKYLLIFFILFGHSKSGFNQTHLTEGVVRYKITYPNITNKDQLMLLPNGMTVYFKQGKARIELTSIQGNSVSIYNRDSGAIWQLTEMLGKKIAMKNSLSKIAKIEGENNLKSGRKITLLSKTKKIAGYKCNGLAVTENLDGVINNYSIWYCKSLPEIGYFNIGPNSENLDGMLLDYIQIIDGLKMHLTAKEVKSTACDDGWFIVPKVYQLINGDTTN